MIDFLDIVISCIGISFIVIGISLGIMFAWCSFNEAAERKRKDTKHLLALLEKIEANTAKAEITPDSDPA